MDIRKTLQENVKKAVKNTLNLDFENIFIEHPENETFGDYSTNAAMLLAKEVHKTPMEIAHLLVDELQSFDINFSENALTYPTFEKIEEVKPGFINFYLSQDWLKNCLGEITQKKDNFGSLDLGKDKTIIIEYSQPNPNKPMHIGHARNNFLGSSLSEIFSFAGYKVLRTNYMNDWGTHICKSMLMYKKYGKNAEPDKKTDHFVGDFYQMYEKEIEKTPGLEEELSEMFRKMESEDSEVLGLWKKITGWAYKGWEDTYKDENVSFDVWMYQSNYRESGKEIVKLALEKGIAEKDETGAVIARLEEKYGIPDKVMLRKDGTSVYVTQDTQLAKDSFEKYHFDKRLYVVDNRQSDYFRQLFKILDILGFSWASKLYHVSYGVVSLPEGSMSSRTGVVLNADDVFAKIIESEGTEIQTSLKSVSAVDSTVRKVALSAFRYGMLKVDPKQDVVFNINQVIKFEGNTGPYLLYTYARACSVLEKAAFEVEKFSFELEDFVVLGLNEKEKQVLRTLYKLQEIVTESVEKLSPHFVANYLYDLAQKFNSFYAEVPVIGANTKEEKEFRIALTKSTAQVVKNGLKLLGIEVVEKM